MLFSALWISLHTTSCSFFSFSSNGTWSVWYLILKGTERISLTLVFIVCALPFLLSYAFYPVFLVCKNKIIFQLTPFSIIEKVKRCDQTSIRSLTFSILDKPVATFTVLSSSNSNTPSSKQQQQLKINKKIKIRVGRDQDTRWRWYNPLPSDCKKNPRSSRICSLTRILSPLLFSSRLYQIP